MFMDDFRIYNKVLSVSEVSELYTGRVDVYNKSYIGIGTTNPASLLDVNGNTNIRGNLGIGNTIPIAMLNIGTPIIGGSDGTLVISKNNASSGRNFKFGYNSDFSFCMGDFGPSTSGNTQINQFIIQQGAPVNSLTLSSDAVSVIILPDTSSGSTTQRYCTIGGLRIAGWDTANTIYNDTRILSLGSLGGIVYKTGTLATNIAERMRIDTSGNVGIGITNPFAMLTIGDVIGTSDGTLVLSKSDGTGGRRNFKFGYNSDFSFCMGDFGGGVTGNTWTSSQFSITWNTGNVGIGTAGQSEKLNVNGTTYLNGATTVNGVLTATSFTGNGANLTNLAYDNIDGKPSTFPANMTTIYTKSETDTLLIAKEAILTFSSPLTRLTNTISINLSNYSTTGTDTNYLLKTGGQLTGNLGIGTTQYSTNTLLSIKGASSGYSQPLVRIEQTTGWNGNYCLQTVGYSDFNGIRINGEDITNSIFTTGANDMGLTTNAGSIKFTVNGAERMRINTTGNIGIANTSPNLTLDIGSTNGNHNIGRAILTTDALNIHAADKRDFLSIGRWDGSSTADWEFTGIKYGVTTAAYAGETTNNHSCMTFYTWGNSISISREVARITSRGRLGINTTAPTELLEVNGNIKATTFLGNLAYASITGKPATFPADMTTIYAKTESDGRYLQLSGGTMTAPLNITSTTTDNQIVITNSSAARYTSIKFFNGTAQCFIGIGGSGLTGTSYYNNNLFFESANSLIFQTAGQTTVNIPRIIINTSGKVGIATTNPDNILQVGDGARLRISNGVDNYSIIGTKDVDDATNTRIVLSGNTRSGFAGNMDYIATSTGYHAFYTTNSTTERMKILNNGNIGIGITNPSAKLHITEASGTQQGPNSGSIIIDHDNNGGASSITFRSAVNRSSDYGYIQYQDTSSVGGGGESAKLIIGTQNDADDDILLLPSGNVGIGIANPTSKLDVNGNIKSSGNLLITGIANIKGVSPYAVPNNNMATGSLCIGSTDVDYGYSTGWSTNTAGIMMECNNITEICVHDSGTRVASLLYYYGSTNQIYIGRDKGWGRSSVFMDGYLQCLLQAMSNSGTDYVGVANADSNNGLNYSRQLYLMFNTFTGFHRCFTDDIEFKEEDPQKFKDDYIGRIVISSGKIATDMKKIDEEWNILYDKEGITIEDALPIIQLSRTKKDKRVFGVLGMASRNNSRAERMIVNSIGEGSMWVCNANGSIQNGDYIQSSDHLGYGERQDDDILHNYSVAKSTMSCSFELDSLYYNCFEIDDLDANGNKLRVAFIAVTYHCG